MLRWSISLLVYRIGCFTLLPQGKVGGGDDGVEEESALLVYLLISLKNCCLTLFPQAKVGGGDASIEEESALLIYLLISL